MNLQKNSFGKRLLRRSVLLAEASALCLMSSSAMAAIVTSPIANLAIPQTVAGVYINIVTGATGTSAGAVTGWDLNPYNSNSGANLGIYWPQTGLTPRGGVVPTAGGTQLQNVPPGTVIGPSSFYTLAIQATNPNFLVTGTETLGLAFVNESTGAVNYGYARIQTTAASGFPATILSITYENTGQPITVPAGGNTPPQFGYTPAPGGTVTATGGTTIGSTGNLSIPVTVATPGAGSGAAATTTTTCTAPTAPFTGFGQTVTAVGAGAISGSPLSGTCTLGAAAVTQTLTCSENRGGTPTAVTFQITCPAGIVVDTPPQFAYSPAAGGTVALTGGGAVGSTGNASITVTTGTAGAGSGAAATTTTTCTAPTAPFAGFGQTVTATGAGAPTGSPLSGTCTLGAAAATQTLTCSENRGGTPTAVTFQLSCPAGSLAPVTSNPASGSTITLNATAGGTATSTVTFSNPAGSAQTVTCTAPAAPFSASPLSIPVPAGGSASTTVTLSSATTGSFTGTLNCTAGATTFTFNLAGGVIVIPVATSVPTLGDTGRWIAMLMLLGVGLAAVAVRRS